MQITMAIILEKWSKIPGTKRQHEGIKRRLKITKKNPFLWKRSLRRDQKKEEEIIGSPFIHLLA